MPWKVYGNCVHKLNTDGSKGKLLHCHESPSKAAAHLRALYANVEEKMSKHERIKAKRKAQLKAEQIELLKETQEGSEPAFEADAELQKQLESLKDDPEGVEKDYYGESVVMPSGPTSWDELEAEEIAQEQAEAVQEATWDVRRLVNNILWHPELNPDDKASAMEAVAKGFAPRVNDILSNADTMEKEVDLDLLSAESILAQDARHTGVWEKVNDLISKARLTTRSRKNIPSEKFALPESRKYPLQDKAHVRNALSRAAQQMKGGGAGAEDARKAMPKIRAAAKQMGIMMSKEGEAILIEKDAAGDWRWIGWPTNNFIDRSKDIITEAAHKEFADWAMQDIEKRGPVYTSLHAPGTHRENPADFVGYQNGFLVMSGKLTENEAAGLMETQKECEIGMSHTSWALRDANDPRQIVKYRMFEVTDLPVEMADNPFTNMEVISKEADMDQLAYLTKLLGSKDRAEEALQNKTSLKQKELTEAQVESKESPAVPVVEAPVTAAVNPDLETLIKKIEERLGMKELSDQFSLLMKEAEKVPVLEAAIMNLTKSQDEKLAEVLTPKVGNFAWMTQKRASQDKETVVKGDDPIQKSKPTDNWLSQVTNTEPIHIDA